MSLALETNHRSLGSPRATAWHEAAWLRASSTHLAFLVLWSLAVFIYGIQQGDLYRTEGLRAIVGAEMYRSGDWVVPRLHGEPILTKPPFYYWCVASVGRVYGEVTVWGTRLPAALSGLLAVLVVYFTVRRYYGAPVGILASLSLPASFLWLDKASSAEIDTTLVMWVIAAWTCFLRAVELSDRPGHSWWLLALLCVAGGVLTKWTGFLFFYAMAVPTLAWRGQLRSLFRPAHVLAALLGACVVCLWLGAVVAELGWSQVWGALWREGSPRVLHSKNASRHLLAETVIHPFKVLAITAPWSLIVLVNWWRRRSAADERTVPQRLVERSLLCWALAGTFMMTIFPDHNTRQSFSLVPAWTLLGVLALWREYRINPNALRYAAVGVLLWLLVKVVYVEVLIPARFVKRPSLPAQASILHGFVPAGSTLYLQGVKDECLFFYYARPVRRVARWEGIESRIEMYCILTEAERRAWPTTLVDRIVGARPLLNAQGEPLVVVRLSPVSIP